eukprot:jgi/Tetstr1/425806/TSEL_016185.t1
MRLSSVGKRGEPRGHTITVLISFSPEEHDLDAQDLKDMVRYAQVLSTSTEYPRYDRAYNTVERGLANPEGLLVTRHREKRRRLADRSLVPHITHTGFQLNLTREGVFLLSLENVEKRGGERRAGFGNCALFDGGKTAVLFMPPFNIDIYEHHEYYLSGAAATRAVFRCTAVRVLSSPGHEFLPPPCLILPAHELVGRALRWRIFPPYDDYKRYLKMSIKAYILEGPYNAMFHPDMKAVVAAWDAPEPGFDPQRAGEQREHPKHKRATAGFRSNREAGFNGPATEEMLQQAEQQQQLAIQHAGQQAPPPQPPPQQHADSIQQWCAQFAQALHQHIMQMQAPGVELAAAQPASPVQAASMARHISQPAIPAAPAAQPASPVQAASMARHVSQPAIPAAPAAQPASPVQAASMARHISQPAIPAAPAAQPASPVQAASMARHVSQPAIPAAPAAQPASPVQAASMARHVSQPAIPAASAAQPASPVQAASMAAPDRPSSPLQEASRAVGQQIRRINNEVSRYVDYSRLIGLKRKPGAPTLSSLLKQHKIYGAKGAGTSAGKRQQ